MSNFTYIIQRLWSWSNPGPPIYIQSTVNHSLPCFPLFFLVSFTLHHISTSNRNTISIHVQESVWFTRNSILLRFPSQHYPMCRRSIEIPRKLVTRHLSPDCNNTHISSKEYKRLKYANVKNQNKITEWKVLQLPSWIAMQPLIRNYYYYLIWFTNHFLCIYFSLLVVVANLWLILSAKELLSCV